MPDSYGYAWNLYAVHNVEDIVVFLGLRVLNFVQLKCAFYFCSETTNENNHFLKFLTFLSSSYLGSY